MDITFSGQMMLTAKDQQIIGILQQLSPCFVFPKQIMTQNRELFAFLSTTPPFSRDGCEASLLFILLQL